MPTKIASASVCNQAGLDSSIEYSARAGRACIADSSLDEADIGLLINIGVYRDWNIHEPALASLIQGRIGLNNNPLDARGRATGAGNGTFSFDLMNGACGFFNALQVIEGFFATNTTAAALIVSSDVHPSCEVQPDFPYDHLGAAMLLTRSENGAGFSHVSYVSSNGEYVGSRTVIDIPNSGARARTTLYSEVDENFCDRLVTFAGQAATEYVERERIQVDQLKYVIAAHSPCDLRPALSQALNLRAQQLIDVATPFGDPFSSFPILGYYIAAAQGLSRGDQLLFVSAGAGLTFGCGLYVV